jgi:hypothetical protein
LNAAAEKDSKIRAEESHKLALAAEKIAQEKRDMEKDAKQKLDKITAAQKEMEI